MSRKGLNKQLVVEAAADLIAHKGSTSFSMRELADHLEIKTASLYNHIENMDALFTEIGFFAIDQFVHVLETAIQEKTREEAVRALTQAYRQFGKEHFEWYQIIMTLPLSGNEALADYPGKILSPIMQTLDTFHLTEEEKLHQQRILRSIMHGFLSQEEHGYFSHFEIDVEKSYTIAIDNFIYGILHAEKEV